MVYVFYGGYVENSSNFATFGREVYFHLEFYFCDFYFIELLTRKVQILSVHPTFIGNSAISIWSLQNYFLCLHVPPKFFPLGFLSIYLLYNSQLLCSLGFGLPCSVFNLLK